MQNVLATLHDKNRLAELERYGIVGTPPEDDYDHISRLTSDLFEAPIALINLVGSDEVWVKARTGIEVQSVPCEIAFCTHTITSYEVLVVPDLSADPRFVDNPLVTDEPRFRYYAGAPLVTPNGHCIGTLCILDTVPRDRLSAKEQNTLKDLARLVMDRLEQRRLYAVESISAKLMAATTDAVVITDATGRITLWNAAAQTLLGLKDSETRGRAIDTILPERLRNTKRNIFRQFIRSNSRDLLGRPIELTACRDSGSEITVEVSLAAWYNTDDGLSGLGAIIRDVSAQKIDARRIAYLAHHDELTSLANRNNLRVEIERLIAAEGPGAEAFAIFSIDLDRFKIINATLGHRIGDRVLVEVSDRLRQCSGAKDIVARLGADEFAILRRGATSSLALTRFARKLEKALGAPYVIDGHILGASGSVGISVWPRDGADCDSLLNHAELARYRAKQSGRGAFCFFEEGMDGQTLAQRALERDLRDALRHDQFEIHYQPQVDLQTGRLLGAEALLRWKHPQRGYVAPIDFIPIAESTGLILPIGEWALKTACTDFAGMGGDLKLAVNLSPVQFHRGDIVSLLRRALRETGLSGYRLEIEVTESLLLEKDADTFDTLTALKSLGVTLALDDFGTGYSSLSYLHDFPFDTLKIDRSFVRDAGSGSGSTAVLEAICALGGALGLTVLAEGIETEAQHAHLRSLGCRQGQGFLFGRPVPLSQLHLYDPRPAAAS